MMFGGISKKEGKKFSFLSLILLFIVGAYWLLRPLKDSIFFGTVGGIDLPLAKTLSVVTVMILVLIYSKLVDIFPKHRLFYVVGTFYLTIFLGLHNCVPIHLFNDAFRISEQFATCSCCGCRHIRFIESASSSTGLAIQ